MSVYVNSTSSNSFGLMADKSSKHSIGSTLLGFIISRRQRMADLEIKRALTALPDFRRDNFTIELERRLSGQ